MLTDESKSPPSERVGYAVVGLGDYALKQILPAFGELKLIVADHVRPLDPSEPQDRWRTQRALAGGGALVDIGIYSLNAARTKRYRLLGTRGWLDLDPATEYSGNRLVLGTDTAREEQIVAPGSRFARQIDHFQRTFATRKRRTRPARWGCRIRC